MKEEVVVNNNKRIAKNTIYLYFRMILVLLVGLYTSRIVLKTLGVSDYGVFNVVGGIIGLLGYINTLLAGGTSRFLTIGLGENNLPKLKITFSTTVVLTIGSALLVILAGETIGLWFVNTHLNIDPLRLDAANWVYQCALLSSALTIMQSPFMASIISHERMEIYAYMSIFDVIMKLLIVYLLVVFDYDKMILYALLMLGVNILNFIIYRIFCIKSFEECRFALLFDIPTFKEMFSFSGWNMLGSLAAVCMTYGVNIVINIFFGTVVNAARGISMQVNSLVSKLYENFQMAGRPQVMKYYAQGEYTNMFNLMYNNSKFCALLLLCVIIPISVNCDGLLLIWLGDYPEYTKQFVWLAFIYIFFKSVENSLCIGIHAVGKMKLPNLTSALINLLILPSTYLAYKLGGSPLWGAIFLAMSVPICFLVDLWLLKRYIQFPGLVFITKVIKPVLLIAILSYIVPLLLRYYTPYSISWTIINTIISLLYVCLIVFFLGLPKNYRRFVINKLNKH